MNTNYYHIRFKPLKDLVRGDRFKLYNITLTVESNDGNYGVFSYEPDPDGFIQAMLGGPTPVTLEVKDRMVSPIPSDLELLGQALNGLRT